MAYSCSNKNYHVFCNIQNPLFSFTDLWTHSLSFFGWYKDECLETAPCSRADLERFINYDSVFHHPLKFTLEISETFLSFLAISVLINGDALASSFHYKPTDSHSYLLFSSSHPNPPRNPSLTPNFCAFAAFAAMTKIWRPNLCKWEPFLVNVAIPPIY